MIDSLWMITVTQEEFDGLYAAAKKNKLSEEDPIREMGESWITKHNYTGWLK